MAAAAVTPLAVITTARKQRVEVTSTIVGFRV